MILVALIVLHVNPLEQFQHIKMKDDTAYVTNSASDSKTLLKYVQLLYLSMRWNSKALVGILEKVCPSYPFTFLGFETKVFGGNISGFWVASCKTLIQLYLWNAAQVTWLFVVLQSKVAFTSGRFWHRVGYKVYFLLRCNIKGIFKKFTHYACIMLHALTRYYA